jgi:hypothetical protein
VRPIRDLIQRFQELKEEALGRVEKAAKTGKVREVSLYAKTADECENALQHLRRLEGHAKRLEEILRSSDDAMQDSRPATITEMRSAPFQIPQSPMHPIISSDSYEDEVIASAAMDNAPSKRSEGINAREVWVAKVESKMNITIRKEGSVTYRVGDRGRVGVAFASELNRLPDRWFLGLPEDDEYNVVVLLCRPLMGETLDFVIPVASLEQDWWRLSRSGGQIKFNVRKDGTEEYSLQVPKAGKHSIGIFLGKLDELEKLTRP